MLPKSSKVSQSLDDDLFDEVDFLNSEECSNECPDKFDFNAKLTDHSNFVVNSKELPSVFEVGESSTKVDDTVPVSAYYAKGKKKKNSQKQNNTGNSKKKQTLKTFNFYIAFN
ncbi:hypothetical protein L6452_27578 [Arctium lappa]|uniref:Uncharacterized protein n=1 Tax=Arctium lappa TaxID=4217 RepID=A0ACB8ZWA6_ARCLA|nr:hypothetical protein L6452_27578 [Arctium lappa]